MYPLEPAKHISDIIPTTPATPIKKMIPLVPSTLIPNIIPLTPAVPTKTKEIPLVPGKHIIKKYHLKVSTQGKWIILNGAGNINIQKTSCIHIQNFREKHDISYGWDTATATIVVSSNTDIHCGFTQNPTAHILNVNYIHVGLSVNCKITFSPDQIVMSTSCNDYLNDQHLARLSTSI